MVGEDIPDLLVFKPTSIPDPVPIPQQILPVNNSKDDLTPLIAASNKTFRTSPHWKIVMGFVYEQYPQAKFRRIYDADTDGWKAKDFHRCCDK